MGPPAGGSPKPMINLIDHKFGGSHKPHSKSGQELFTGDSGSCLLRAKNASHIRIPHYLAVDDLEKAECLANSLEFRAPMFSYYPTQRKPLYLSHRRGVWKKAEVIGIHEPGRPRDLPASYRLISLLSLKTRLSERLFGKGLIINEQFGFPPNNSCPQQAFRLVKYITEGFKIKKRTAAVFFYVAKTFDRVWHADRRFMFRHENIHFTRRLIRAGVPQGFTLSPLLYSAYTNDIPRPSAGVQLALSADDTTLYLRGATERNICHHLQRAIDEMAL
ncbi:Probable RNA-directed DNA polymerase from transposon BS [Eumeta japonica]|uniref:Probable RNA-directed DNA polymerase from transposon BS n=1 Tax=Eumeta variegata TaxID=151549 RepID=A0A4C1V5U1_EUMVA|nr:Probable RNA-directed DNA polymerase from transposon BS [Eumeta japonica]